MVSLNYFCCTVDTPSYLKCKPLCLKCHSVSKTASAVQPLRSSANCLLMVSASLSSKYLKLTQFPPPGNGALLGRTHASTPRVGGFPGTPLHVDVMPVPEPTHKAPEEGGGGGPTGESASAPIPLLLCTRCLEAGSPSVLHSTGGRGLTSSPFCQADLLHCSDRCNCPLQRCGGAGKSNPHPLALRGWRGSLGGCSLWPMVPAGSAGKGRGCHYSLPLEPSNP